MSLEENFISIRTTIYNSVEKLFEKLAVCFGYPENPGMPTNMNKPYFSISDANLPQHQTDWPPLQRPQTWFEMLIGPTPKLDTVPRYVYENKEEGFYNFYVENYKNNFFLPDFISEFIQIKFKICLDISSLEIVREIMFIWLLAYCQIVTIRIVISWFITLNPYTAPWAYIVAAVDWVEDAIQGLIPSLLGVNITATIFLGVLGVIADSLNHLVFTMPFLPSEGEKAQVLINQEMKDVLVFHFLPILWYRNSIPNNIREFWYYQREDILTYMQTVYKDLNIQFLPDSILENSSQTHHLVSQINTDNWTLLF